MDTVLKYAKERGYESAEYRLEWYGYSVYEMVSDFAYTGYPQYILKKGSALRVAELDEIEKILDVLNERS